MPWLDRTGPVGRRNNRRGLGLGPCGCGMKRGWQGWGDYGYGFRGYTPYADNASVLEAREKILEEELAEIRAAKSATKE